MRDSWKRARTWWSGRSRPLRALLCLGGLVFAAATTGTYAHWTDDVAISGTTFTSGTIDLRVNSLNAVTSSTLSMTGGTPMVPGNSSAEVLTLRNSGTAPLKWTMTGGLGGTDAAAYNSAGSLRVRVVVGGTRSGTGNAATCTGGTELVAGAALTTAPGTAIVSNRQGPIAPTATVNVCLQVTLASDAPATLQGKTATATFTLTGTSDVS
jgi:predicted ribosomally synthesized peptide with SipW-like signal peptide